MIITIDLTQEISQTAYAEEKGIALSTVSQQIRSGKILARDIPELNLRLVKLEPPIKRLVPAPPLHHYSNNDLGKYFLDLLNNQAVEEFKQNQKIEHLEATIKIKNMEISIEQEEIRRLEFEATQLRNKKEELLEENTNIRLQLEKLKQERNETQDYLIGAHKKINDLENTFLEQERKISALTAKLETSKELNGLLSILKDSVSWKNKKRPFTKEVFKKWL